MAEAVIIPALKFVGGVLFPAAGASIGAKIASVAAWTALSVGVNQVVAAQRSFPNQGRVLDLGISSDMPRRIQIGRRANAGILVDWHTRGNKNQFLYLVVYLHDGPADLPNRIWADGRIVYNGQLNHGQQVELTEYRSPDARAWVTCYDGRPGQTVDAELQSEFSVGTNYRGEGFSYAVIKLLWDPDTTAVLPGFAFEGGGSHFYDRRLDTTAGGSGSHRLNDPATWQSSQNPAVALDHYLLGRSWSGDSRPRFGVGLDAADVPYSRFASLANICEEQVSLQVSGTQDRYQANGFIESNQQHKTVILELCKAMDARPADFGGQVSAISHAASSSIMTITDEDVVANIPESYQPKRSWAELVAGAQGTYQDPNSGFRPVEYPRVEDASWATEDGGVAKTVEVSFPFETDPARAQRLARLYVQKERRQAVLSGAYLPRTIELEEGDWFTRSGDRFGGGKVFEVISPPILDPNTMTVQITAIEVDPTDSAWDNADEVQVDVPVGDPNTTPPVLPVPNVTFSTVTYTFGQYSFTGLRYNHTEFDDGLAVTIEIEVADNSGGSPDTNNVRSGTIPAGRQYSSIVGVVLPGQTYHTRVRARVGARVSDWSSWTQFVALSNAQYGVVGDGTATLGSNVYAEDGTTLLGNADLITSQGQAQTIAGQGDLALADNVGWGSDITGRPGELTDGRVAAGLDSSGNVLRRDQSNLLGRSGGGLYTGDLAATLGAAWNGNISGQPSDASVITSLGQAQTIAGQGDFATYTGTPFNFEQSFRVGNGGPFNDNAFFIDPIYSTGVPPGWNDWVNGTTLSRGTFYNRPVVNGDASPSSVANLGLSKYIYNLGGARKVKARIVWRRNAGSYLGAGMHITNRNSSNTNLQTVNINCATEAPVGGVVSTTHDGIQVWEKVYDLPAGTDRILFYPMWKWTSFGVPANGLGLSASLLECSITPVDETERRTDTQTDNADQTSQNQAQTIVGQGDLALLDSVTEGLISVPNIAAINANLGAITGGSLNINGRFIVASDGTTQILSATSGARLALNNSVLEVYDASNNLRVRLGIW